MFPDIDRLHRVDWRRETGKAHTAAFHIAVCIDRSNSLHPLSLTYTIGGPVRFTVFELFLKTAALIEGLPF